MLAEATQLTAQSDVLAALKQASAATGSDFSYLLATAMRESNLHPQAKSGTSSASGLFQFVEQTWFGLVKQYGAKHGLASFANAIMQAGDGHFEADNASDRHAILALRNDPRIAALMAGEYANATRASLEASLGRNVSNGELYAAHFFGPEAACRLIRMSSAQPQSCAATAFPQAAASNHSVFYRPDGTAKSVQEVLAWALKQPAAQTAAAIEPAPASEPAPSSNITVTALPPTTAPVTASIGEDSLAVQLWSAMQAGSPSILSAAAIPQTPLAATPDILDLLGTMAEHHKIATLRTKVE
jgi:hypothetical protein